MTHYTNEELREIIEARMRAQEKKNRNKNCDDWWLEVIWLLLSLSLIVCAAMNISWG